MARERNLSVFVDTDYAGYKTDRKSISEFSVKLGDCVMNCCPEKKDSVALSTCEGE